MKAFLGEGDRSRHILCVGEGGRIRPEKYAAMLPKLSPSNCCRTKNLHHKTIRMRLGCRQTGQITPYYQPSLPNPGRFGPDAVLKNIRKKKGAFI